MGKKYFKLRIFIFGSILLFLVIFIMASLPNLGISEQFLHGLCKSNLNEISLAIKQYELDNKSWPTNLKLLVSTGRLRAKYLICPLACLEGGISLGEIRYFGHLIWNRREYDYIYLRPSKLNISNTKSKIIVCLDRLKNHQDSTNDVNVMYDDGTTDTIMIKDYVSRYISKKQ